MALSPNPLDRNRVLVQAQSTGARYSAGSSNAALRLASSLQDLEPTLAGTLGNIAQKEADKKRAEGRKAALENQGAALADAVRAGKIKPTQNPWFMEAYAKESAALRSQQAFTQLQTESTTWAERNDPAAFGKKWAEGVAAISQGFTGKDEQAGFDPIQRQFSQQVLQSNTSENQQRIVTERKQNVSSLAAQALSQAASRSGGTLSGQEAIAALAPSREMWLATGGSEEEWHTLQVQAITAAAYGSKNSGLLSLTQAIGLDGQAVLDGRFGSGSELTPQAPTLQAPAPVLAGHSLPEQFRLPVPAALARVTDPFGKHRAGGKVHNGLDLAVPEGTQVTSPGVGRVVAVGSDKQSGNFVKVDHGNGLVSSYAHLSRQDVKVGDQVAPGAVLGASGSTGHSTGPHLHWVVRQGGQTINPRSAKFPQGQEGGAVAQAAQALAPQAPVDATAPPPPEVAKGPSLYDIAGAADAIESDRYRITQAQEDALTRGLQTRKAAIQNRAAEATDYLYAQHGTGLLLGNYDTGGLVKELAGKGYTGPEIQETLRQLSDATSSSASMSRNRFAINDADPSKAHSVMDLALDGQRSGYSEAYEHRVGEAVLRGDITGEEGTRMVSGAISTSRQKQAEARAEARADRAEEARTPGVIHNYTQLKQQGTSLAGLAATIYMQKTTRPASSQERQKIKGLVDDALGAWLSANPGDFAGAYQAAREAVASYGARIRAPGALLQKPSTASPNPRGGQ